MADIIISGNVSSDDPSTRTESIRCAEAISAGDAVYLDTTTENKARPVSVLSAAATVVKGVALTSGAALDDYIIVATSGKIKTGATGLSVGAFYYATSTGIGLYAELASTNYVAPVYQATSTTEAIMAINNQGLQIP